MNATITIRFQDTDYTPTPHGELRSVERRCKVGDVRAIGGDIYHCINVLRGHGALFPPPALVTWRPAGMDAWKKVTDAIRGEIARFAV